MGVIFCKKGVVFSHVGGSVIQDYLGFEDPYPSIEEHYPTIEEHYPFLTIYYPLDWGNKMSKGVFFNGMLQNATPIHLG